MIYGKVLGGDALQARLAKVRAELPSLLSKERLGSFLLRRMRARYLRQEAPDGSPWKALSPESKQGSQILIQSGRLFKATRVLSTNPGNNFGTATGFGFRIGVLSEGGGRKGDPAVYGRAHQLGLGVPKRKFLGVGKSDVLAVDSLLRRELRKVVTGG